MNRFAKQLAYGILFIAILVFIVWGGFKLFTSVPSCTDGILNGNEEGIDCGVAACGKQCAPTVMPLTIGEPIVIMTPQNEADVIFTMTNPNATLGISELPYTLELFDSTGALITSRRGITKINPAQSRPVAITILGISKPAKSARVTISQNDANWEKVPVAGVINASFAVRDERLNTTDSGVIYEAVVINQSQYGFGTVEVVAILRDDNGVPIGVGTTILQTITPSERRDIKITWPFAISGASRADVTVFTNLMDARNYLRPSGPDVPQE